MTTYLPKKYITSMIIQHENLLVINETTLYYVDYYLGIVYHHLNFLCIIRQKLELICVNTHVFCAIYI